jgi:hypothetical protein
MFGKHFASMYTGSMFGAGAVRFAVMGYVLSHMVPDRVVGMQVELNPRLLAAILGEPDKEVSEAIEWLCKPDPRSRTKVKDGRRLVRLGEFDYQVVNGVKYRAIRDQENRREQNREAQDRHRKKKVGPLPGEQSYLNVAKAGGSAETLDRMTDPDSLRETGTKYQIT